MVVEYIGFVIFFYRLFSFVVFRLIGLHVHLEGLVPSNSLWGDLRSKNRQIDSEHIDDVGNADFKNVKMAAAAILNFDKQ